MEPSQKRARITGHFRVALKPQDVNIVPSFKRFKRDPQDPGKENNKIEVITIDDDSENNNNNEPKPTTSTNNSQNVIANNFKPNQLNLNLNQHHHQQPLRLVTQQQQQQLDSSNTSGNKKQVAIERLLQANKSNSPINKYEPPPGLLAKVDCDIINYIVDFDESVKNDIHFEPHYAWDSFNYDKQRELLFQNKTYLDRQQISTSMRAKLVDWLVFIQNNFSLDHEALYMAVKISDQYLMKKTCQKCYLPLLYMTSILISSKFEERIPPVSIAELMDHLSRKYNRRQVLLFEAELLKALNFDIRFPLSYTFLRRFAICTKSDKITLTLARYILESSLLEYDMIDMIESKLAAASLLLAFKMLNLDDDHNNNRWDETAIYYTGYQKEELLPILKKLNQNICTDKVYKSITRKKYSHQLFLHVARIPPLSLE